MPDKRRSSKFAIFSVQYLRETVKYIEQECQHQYEEFRIVQVGYRKPVQVCSVWESNETVRAGIDEKKYFNMINIDKVQSYKYVYTATRGLLHFRENEYKNGRLPYEKAESMAPDKSSKQRVALFRSREELNARTPEADN